MPDAAEGAKRRSHVNCGRTAARSCPRACIALYESLPALAGAINISSFGKTTTKQQSCPAGEWIIASGTWGARELSIVRFGRRINA